jgi:hypothetical protein
MEEDQEGPELDEDEKALAAEIVAEKKLAHSANVLDKSNKNSAVPRKYRVRREPVSSAAAKLEELGVDAKKMTNTLQER